MAAIGDCLEMATWGSPGASSTPMTQGFITWMSRSQGDRVLLNRGDYLNRRADAFHQEIEAPLKLYGSPYYVDDKIHRTPEGISLAYTLDREINYDKFKTTGISAVTLIRHFPVEVTFVYTAPIRHVQKGPAALYNLMDKFLAQQVMLNE